MPSHFCLFRFNVIIADRITPLMPAEKYLDKEDYENELKQGAFHVPRTIFATLPLPLTLCVRVSDVD